MLATSAEARDGHVLRFVKAIGVPGGWVSFVAFSPDGKIVASNGPTGPGDWSGQLGLWTYPLGRFVKRVPVRPLALSPDWHYVASDSGVSDVHSGKVVIPSQDGTGFVFSQDNRFVAFAAKARRSVSSIRVVRLPDLKPVKSFGVRGPFELAMNAHGTMLASGYWDEVVLWNVKTGKRQAVLRGIGRYAISLAFSRDGRFLAVGTDAGGIQIWDVRRHIRLHKLELGGGEVSEPAFSPDGRFVAVGIYGTGSAWLLDTVSGKLVDKQKISDIGCGSVAFSPDGRLLIAASTGGLIRWPYDYGGTIRIFRVDRSRMH